MLKQIFKRTHLRTLILVIIFFALSGALISWGAVATGLSEREVWIWVRISVFIAAICISLIGLWKYLSPNASLTDNPIRKWLHSKSALPNGTHSVPKRVLLFIWILAGYSLLTWVVFRVFAEFNLTELIFIGIYLAYSGFLFGFVLQKRKEEQISSGDN
jgi:hypothetical protein